MVKRENLLDSRFIGRVIKVKLSGVENLLEGIVDEVARYELGLRIRDKPYIIFRHAVLYTIVPAMDLHGESREELEDVILTPDFVGEDVSIGLIDGNVLEGRLMKVSRYEIGLRRNDDGLIIPKSNIAYLVFGKEED